MNGSKLHFILPGIVWPAGQEYNCRWGESGGEWRPVGSVVEPRE